jgi:checkpoint serine/threonine-protein kinase
MVKLWIKYIDFQPNKPNLYKILYQQGIGTKCAAFYIAWAHYYNYYNSDNSLKQAESIYNLGLQLKAEPLHELENAQKNFRYSVAQRMLYNDESSKKRTISSLAEQREQITSLSPHPSNNSQSSQPALKKARTESSGSDYGHSSGYSSPYNSQNGYQQGASVSQQQAITPNIHATPTIPPQYGVSNDYYPQTSEIVYPVNIPNQYNYGINSYSAPSVQQQVSYTFDCGFQKPLNFINSAHNSHESWDGLLFLEEPYDPNRRCFYPKNQVYPGDGCEYSLEELMAVKWRMKMEEKKKREEQERIRLEQERQRQEAERIRQEQEARRLREEQEAMRIKMEQQKAEAERIRKQQQEEEQRRYQMYQQQQQWNAYHSPVSYGSPAPYHYQHSPYQNSPQYSYAHDHQYQTNYSPHPPYQHSPHNYQNSANYHAMPQGVIVNRNQYETQHNYYQNYAPHVQQQTYVETNYQYNHVQVQPPQQQQPQKSNFEEPDYQDVEYLIDHQGEIDPQMLKQPIVEDSDTSGSEESEEEQIPTIVNSYMLDDLEEQIEASTISFSSNGKSRDKKITIKFRKEKTIIANSESNSSSSQQRLKVPLEPSSTSSSSQSSSKKKVKNKNELLTSFDGENTQFMPSATNSNSSINNGDQTFGKITFNGCVTPVRKQAASKTSTPVSSYKFLKNKSSFLSQNDESFTGDQNSFFQAENDDDFRSRRLEKALASIDENFKKRDIDPFNSELCRAFLTKINFPQRDNTEDYKVISSNLPKFAKNHMVSIGGLNYQLEKEVGRGSYGYVYR